jgi:Phosphotransferase enzyme family
MTKPSLFSVPYDDLFDTKGSDEFTAWKESYLVPDVLLMLEKFVTDRIVDRGSAKYIETKEGSYNLVFRFHFETGGDVVLRVPQPGNTAAALVAEKVNNEVNWMKFLGEMTSIPVPKVYSFGTHAPDLIPRLELPFIIMDFLPGESLRSFLFAMSKPGIADDEKRDKIYEQIANFYLQLYNLRFDAIGSVSKDMTSGRWAVMNRPLTMDMHELVLGIPNFPTEQWPHSPFKDSTCYLNFIIAQQRRQLWALRNLNIPREYDESIMSSVQQQHGADIDLEGAAQIARARFLARLGFEKLAVHFCSMDSDKESSEEGNGGSFVPFNTDFDPRNMLVNIDGDITGLIDLEFTNAMPATFASDPPLWLLGVKPKDCLEANFFSWFQAAYQPLLDRFIAALKRVEDRGGLGKRKKLSERMLESWESGRVWFNFAANNTDQVDSFYWTVLHGMHPEGTGVIESPENSTDIERYVEHTKKQIKVYEEEWKAGMERVL